MTSEPLPKIVTRNRSFVSGGLIPDRSMMIDWLFGPGETLPERSIVRSAALLLLPKIPSPPEAWSTIVRLLIVAGSIRLSSSTRSFSGLRFEPATPPSA